MSNKLRISKPGYNVLTETDSNNLIFDSDFDTLKYFATANAYLEFPLRHTDLGGGIDYNVAPLETLETTHRIRHDLGYVPIFDVIVQHMDYPGAYLPNLHKNITGRSQISAYATTQDIILFFHIYNTQSNAYLGTGRFQVIVKIFRNRVTF